MRFNHNAFEPASRVASKLSLRRAPSVTVSLPTGRAPATQERNLQVAAAAAAVDQALRLILICIFLDRNQSHALLIVPTESIWVSRKKKHVVVTKQDVHRGKGRSS